MNYQALVREFYREKAGGTPDSLDAQCYLLEEWGEFIEAAYGTHELKEMADVMYTLYGLAESLGYDLDAAFLAVHESNMTKSRTETGKVQKGPDYVAPDLSRFLR